MYVLNVRNVNQALPIAIDFIQQVGVPRSSRYGDVLVANQPVTTVYNKPQERVIFWKERDANPFFHFMESLWMLAGRNDVKFLKKYAKRMAEFSDDGITFHAAYGHRWRKHFGFDQLDQIIEMLKENPDDRRQILSIWDANTDHKIQKKGCKDIPCNDMVHFQINTEGELDMSVFNRSNDIIWGCYGANAVQFSVLQEYMASSIGVPLGKYRQISDNWHGYKATLTPLLDLADKTPSPYNPDKWERVDPYASETVKPFPLMSTEKKIWDQDLLMFMEGSVEFGYRDPFFRRVAKPIYFAYDAYKENGIDAAIEIMQQCMASDWKLACIEWLERRRK